MPATSQDAVAALKVSVLNDLAEASCSASRPASMRSKGTDERALATKPLADRDGAAECDNELEDEQSLNNLPLQIDYFGKNDVPLNQIYPKKSLQPHLKHEISQSTSSIFRMGLTSNEMTMEAPSITCTQSHSRNVLEDNQKMDPKQQQNLLRAPGTNESSHPKLSLARQEAPQATFTAETPHQPTRKIETDESKLDAHDEEPSKELSFHKDYEMAFNAERSSSRFSSHQRSKRGLSDCSQASF